MKNITAKPGGGGSQPMPSGRRGKAGKPRIKVGGVTHKLGTAKPARRGAPR